MCSVARLICDSRAVLRILKSVTTLNCHTHAVSIHFFIVTRNLTNQEGRPRALPVRLVAQAWQFVLLSLVLTTSFEVAAAARLQRSPGTEGPEVSIASTKRDFGDVFAGEELEQYFPVRNLGSKQLELDHKSALGTGSSGPGYKLIPALWRPNDRLPARAFTANRAAPS